MSQIRPESSQHLAPAPMTSTPSASQRTTNGLFAMARMLRSFLTLCTMFLRIRSALRITLIANRSPVAFFLACRR